MACLPGSSWRPVCCYRAEYSQLAQRLQETDRAHEQRLQLEGFRAPRKIFTAKEAAHGEPAASKEYAAAPVAYENCLATSGPAVNHQAEAARSSATPALPKPKTLLQLPPHGRAGVSAAAAEIGQAEPGARHKGFASSPYEPSEAGQDGHDEHTGRPEQEMQIEQLEQPIAQEGGKHVGQHAMCSQGITTLLPDLEVSQAAQKAVHSLFQKASVQTANGACEEITISRKHQNFSKAAAPGPDADQAWPAADLSCSNSGHQP